MNILRKKQTNEESRNWNKYYERNTRNKISIQKKIEINNRNHKIKKIIKHKLMLWTYLKTLFQEYISIKYSKL